MQIIRTQNSIHTRSRGLLYVGIIVCAVLAVFFFSKWYSIQEQKSGGIVVGEKTENGNESVKNDFSFSIADQPAGSWVAATDMRVPEDFWLAIYEMREGDYGNILGAAHVRQGTASTSVELLRPMVAGQFYAGVVHQDDGDVEFDYTRDIPVERDGARISKQFRAL